jgi:hypothetical protein
MVFECRRFKAGDNLQVLLLKEIAKVSPSLVVPKRVED